MNVRLTQEQKIKVLNSDDVYGVMQRILLRENKIKRNKEHFWIVGLNIQNKILFIELMSVDGVEVEPSDVFRIAILKMAKKIILVQNHSSDNITPSSNDKELTSSIKEAGRIVKIRVVEHLLISEKKYLSFVNEKLL